MASTLAAMRASLRALVGDQQAPYQWVDAVLSGCLSEAIAEHSYLFPAQVTLVADTAAGQTSYPLYAADSLGPVVAAPVIAGNADLIAVQRVELPAGTVLPVDPGQATDPAASASSNYRQAYRWRGALVYLRNPASGAEVGAATCRMEILQTYSQPTEDGTIRWDGPANDQPLVLLLAKRRAYQTLGEWWARDGAAQPGDVTDLVNLLAALDAEIAQAIAVRQRRAVRSRTLDI